MDLTIVGAGYVGLVTGAVFASLGHSVKIVEIDQGKIDLLRKGKVPFFEPGLKELIEKALRQKKLEFTSSYRKAILGSEIIFICVGTPQKNGRADLSFLYSSIKSVAKTINSPVIIVVKSTVPPGINNKLAKFMRKFTKVNFQIASVPEFLREGKAIEDSLHPHRVVIGSEEAVVAKKLLELHRKISGKRLICDPASAQMIKYASNAFLPTKISFANSISVLCEKYGADIKKVMKGVGMDKRIGPDFLAAGLGYGGSCFPKDVAALINLSQKAGYSFPILKAVEKTNQKQIDLFIKKLIRLCGGTLKNKTLVVLGLSFKPNTSDMREARSLYVIERLSKFQCQIRVCDPVAIPEAKKILGEKVTYFDDPYQALKTADALVLATEWDEYKNLDFDRIKKEMRNLVVLDGRNVYSRNRLEKKGFIYKGIGQ